MKNHWPHAPHHYLGDRGAYIVTAGTHHKEHFFPDGPKLKALHDGLLKYAQEAQWQLQAWAIFPNHYHFVATSPKKEDSASSLSDFIAKFHQRSASWVNEIDGQRGRKIWHNFWETHLTYEKSYFARLNYVQCNALHHGLVAKPTDYPYCSASWFERNAPKSFVKTVASFKTDQVHILDDF
jgi:putative transposase